MALPVAGIATKDMPLRSLKAIKLLEETVVPPIVLSDASEKNMTPSTVAYRRSTGSIGADVITLHLIACRRAIEEHNAFGISRDYVAGRWRSPAERVIARKHDDAVDVRLSAGRPTGAVTELIGSDETACDRIISAPQINSVSEVVDDQTTYDAVPGGNAKPDAVIHGRSVQFDQQHGVVARRECVWSGQALRVAVNRYRTG